MAEHDIESGVQEMEPGLRVLNFPPEELIVTDEMLRIPEGAATGDFMVTRGGRGQLTQLEHLENRELYFPVGLIFGNPDQPREYFNPEKLAATATSCRVTGQEKAIDLVPYLDNKEIAIRFVIVDGERRHRAISVNLQAPYIRGIVRWVPSARRIFEDAFVINLQAEKHNAIEEARGVKKLLAFAEADGAADPMAVVSGKTGFSLVRIKNLVKLLAITDAYPEIQTMIMEGKMDTGSALMLPTAVARHGAKLPLVRMARILMDGLDRPADPFAISAGPAIITQKTIRKAVRRALMEGPGEEDVARMDLARAVLAVPTSAGRIERMAMRLVRGDAALVDEFLKRRGIGNPVEAMRDQVLDARAAMDQLLRVLDRAIRPAPLEIPMGLPRFSSHIKRIGVAGFGNNPQRFEIAKILAQKTDTNKGDVMLVTDIAMLLKIEPRVVVGHLRFLAAELEQHDLVLDTHTMRIKGSSDSYEQKTAYRLNWTAEMHAKTKRVRGEALPTRDQGLTVQDIALWSGRSQEEVMAVLDQVRALLEPLGLTVPTIEKLEKTGDGEKYRKVDGLRLDWTPARRAAAEREIAAMRAAAAARADRAVDAALEGQIKYAQSALDILSGRIDEAITEHFGNPEIHALDGTDGKRIVRIKHVRKNRFVIRSNVKNFLTVCETMRKTFGDMLAEWLEIKERVTLNLEEMTSL